MPTSSAAVGDIMCQSMVGAVILASGSSVATSMKATKQILRVVYKISWISSTLSYLPGSEHCHHEGQAHDRSRSLHHDAVMVVVRLRLNMVIIF